MANLPESATWEAGVYQLETTDPVVGGVSGVSNTQAKQLANRTTYLKQEQDAIKNGSADIDVQTKALGNDTTKPASTAFVKLNGFRFSEVKDVGTSGTTLAAHDVNKVMKINVAGWTELPVTLAVEGLTCAFINNNVGAHELRPQGAETIRDNRGNALDELVLHKGEWVLLTRDGGNWRIFSASDSIFQTGEIIQGFAEPQGSLLMDGSLVSRSDYPRLWAWVQANLSTLTDAAWNSGVSFHGSFSTGDGSTTFRLPNLTGAFLRGADSAGHLDPDNRSAGSYQGDELKAHTHDYQEATATVQAGDAIQDVWQGNTTQQTGSTGGSETRPKNFAVGFYIKF